MERKITLAAVVALVVGIAAFVGPEAPVEAQRTRTFIFDSGIVKLGENQHLVLMVDASLDSDITFHEYAYGAPTCEPGTNRCVANIIDSTAGPVRNLAIGEGASDTVAYVPTASGRRITVTSRNPNLTVLAQIVDPVTGAIYSSYVVQSGPNAG